MAYIANAFVGLTGQEISSFELPWEGFAPADVHLEGPAVETAHIAYLKQSRGHAPGDVTGVEVADGKLTVTVEPSTNRPDWTLVVDGKKYNKDEFTVKTRTADDKFTRHEEGRLMYRLYTPDAAGPRPMILFLHGGGNGGPEDGRDNNKHIMADYGPVNFAEDYPDVYVLAPMCVEKPFLPGRLPNTNPGFASGNQTPDWRYGWTRYYLGLVCDLIRRMIKEGKVDPKRVYVTGMSAGGAGTLRAMSVGSDLFAAAVPVCPTMTPETFAILCSINKPIWVSTSYVDHTIYRHKYIVDGVMSMRDHGNNNAHLTIYSPEELAKYDIGITPNLPYPELFSQNHWAWVPTYKNEYGIMSWMFNQSKD